MKLPRKVYAIQHNQTTRIYIGSSATPETRYMNHMYLLRNGKHPVSDMQDDFDTFGEDYSFFILDEITKMEDCSKEYEWMSKYKSCIRGVGYNYKDKATNHIYGIANIPYRSGVPETNMELDCKKELLELIETLSESQTMFLLTFMKEILGRE